MCSPVPCKVCGKTTWAGCGQHIDAVKAQVPASQWCPGHTREEIAQAKQARKQSSPLNRFRQLFL